MLRKPKYRIKSAPGIQLALCQYVVGENFDELLEKKDGIVPFALQSAGEKVEALLWQ